MSAVVARRSFGALYTERARLHASLSRLWVMHHRLIRVIDAAASQHDDCRRLSQHRNVGRCETYIVRIELRLSALSGRLRR